MSSTALADDKCKEDKPARKEAEARLAAVGRKIDALRDDAPFADLAHEVESLLSHACLANARAGAAELPQFDSALSFRQWWNDGGSDWLDSAFERRRLTIPPEPRRTVSLERFPNAAISPLLCRLGDASCGNETAGWALRAEQHFDTSQPDHAKDERKCAADARRAAPRTRFPQWRACVEKLRARQTALPLGRFRAPETGWLILRGRRGHYDYCDEIRLYDLATGSAWVAKGCDKLFRDASEEESKRALGPPDDDTANKKRALERSVTIESGTVVRENLREAAWFLLLADHVDSVAERETFDVPAEVSLRPLEKRDEILPKSRVVVWTSSQTTISWTWAQGTRVLASGTFIWDGVSSTSGYTQRLLAVAEASLRPGCPPATPPRPLPGDTPAVNRIDAAPVEVLTTRDRLMKALEERQRCQNAR